ncbi:MAG: ATP synthase F0 subunit B [bacterium]|nr:ATP synthase F0 subunit B [bacterium]
MTLKTLATIGIYAAWGLSTAWAAEGGGEHHGIPGKAVIFAVINFLILAILLGYLLRKPVKDFFASRAALIKQDIEESQNLRDRATEKYQEYDQRLKNIEAEMNALTAELKEAGELERKRIVEEAHERVSAMKDTSERVMAQELRRAKEELKRDAVVLAAELAEKLVRENITPEDQERIVKQYIDKMEHLS